jgi:collagenase-like PrtC family protease
MKGIIMKLVTPLRNINYYESLVESGADEFYCGFISDAWLENYQNIIPMNRRESLFTANICNYSSMKILSKMMKKYNIPVKITVNSLYYLEEQYELIVEMIKSLLFLGFKTFIISDIALIMYLRNLGIKCNIHLSGETSEINSMSIKLFNQFNISRYIFTRKNSINDMKSCIANCSKNPSFEAFILNELCPYSGAFCNSIHCDEFLQTCKIPYKVRSINNESIKLKEVKDNARKNVVNEKIRNSIFASSGCGICKIMTLRSIGVKYLKIVGRSKSLDYIKDDVTKLKKIIALDKKNSLDFETIVKDSYLFGECPDLCYYRTI